MNESNLLLKDNQREDNPRKRIHLSPAKILKRTLQIIGSTIGALLLFILLNLVVWVLTPPLTTHQLAKDLGRTGQFITIQGIDTYYETHGTGSPLILIPPAIDSTDTWRYNIPTLSKQYQVYALDLPGSGLTGKPSTFPYTHKAYAAFANYRGNRPVPADGTQHASRCARYSRG